MVSTKPVLKKAYLSFDIGIVNLACCLLDENHTILLWNLMNISGSTVDKQCENLIMELDKINYDSLEEPYDITVVIERQPSKNPKMRVISGQIQMYFCLEKYYFKQNKPTNTTIVSKVVFYSPKHKLRCYKKETGDPEIVEKKYKSAYTARKKLAIQHCSIMIRRPGKQKQCFIDFFDKNKSKADDAADSMLQGISYIMGF